MQVGDSCESTTLEEGHEAPLRGRGGLQDWEGSGSKYWGMVLSDQEMENLKVKRSYVGKVGRVKKRPGRGGVAVAEVRKVSTSRECSCG